MERFADAELVAIQKRVTDRGAQERVEGDQDTRLTTRAAVGIGISVGILIGGGLLCGSEAGRWAGNQVQELLQPAMGPRPAVEIVVDRPNTNQMGDPASTQNFGMSPASIGAAIANQALHI